MTADGLAISTSSAVIDRRYRRRALRTNGLCYLIPMTGVRWGFTFLIGTSLLNNDQRLELIAKATLLYLNGEERSEISGDGYEGVLYTNREWKVIGGFSGQ